METFLMIIHNILNKNDNIFKIIFAFHKQIKDTTIPLYKRKFLFLKDALQNFGVKYQKEKEILDYFCKIQHAYHVLSRFAFLYKYKKAKTIVNTDMFLNELHENDKNVICIYQENAKYLFKMYDLLKMINMSLMHAQNLFSDPQCIKNPYNNVPFNKSTLYYIHYFLTEKTKLTSHISYTILFLQFHRCQFHLSDFLHQNEYLLREKTIANFVKNTCREQLYEDIMIMLDHFNKNKKEKETIQLDENFPKNKIVQIFSPYLHIYLNSKYLLVPMLKYKALCDLERKLKRFKKFNPLFGRVKIIYKSNIDACGKIRKYKLEEKVNDHHISFYEYDKEDFLKDHLTYKYMNYDSMFFINSIIEQDEDEDDDDDEEQDEDEDEEQDEEQDEDDDESIS